MTPQRRIDVPVALVSLVLLAVAAGLLAIAFEGNLGQCEQSSAGVAADGDLDSCDVTWNPSTWLPGDIVPALFALPVLLLALTGLWWSTRRS